MNKPSVAILGASTDRSKFGNKAVRAFVQQGFDVYPVNPKVTEIEGLRTYPRLADVPARPLDRVSVYLPPQVGIKLLDEIAKSGAKEVWLNPGTASDELLARAEELGLNVIQACSIVAVGISPHHLPDE
jgi:predicted CoA-binding protein